MLLIYKVPVLFGNISKIAKRKKLTIGVYQVLYALLITSHLMACAWLVLNRVQENPKTWFNSAGLEAAPPGQVYLEALFYVVTTMMGMGFGNLTP